jgi:hypothetical protein
VTAIATDANPDGERGAFARSESQLQICGVLLLNEASALLEEARAIFTHEDAERLAHEVPLADVEQVGGGAIDFENRRVWLRDDRGIRHFVEQFPVLRLLVALLRLQFFDSVALIKDVFLCEPEFLEGAAQFLERAGQQRRVVAPGLCSSLERMKTLKRRDQSQFESINTH